MPGCVRTLGCGHPGPLCRNACRFHLSEEEPNRKFEDRFGAERALATWFNGTVAPLPLPLLATPMMTMVATKAMLRTSVLVMRLMARMPTMSTIMLWAMMFGGGVAMGGGWL